MHNKIKCLNCYALLSKEQIVQVCAGFNSLLNECAFCHTLLYSDDELWDIIDAHVRKPSADSWDVTKMVFGELRSREARPCRWAAMGKTLLSRLRGSMKSFLGL